MIYLLLSTFLLLAAWAYFSWRQQKNYQEALKQYKGALLQAIEALHSRRLKQKIDAINQRRLETIEASLAVGTFPGHTIIEDKIEDRIEDEIEDNIKNSIEDDKEDALKEENDEYLS
ncbi:MAG: hypothetical protein AB7V37_00050 [Eubacteriaceae bacterium]